MNYTEKCNEVLEFFKEDNENDLYEKLHKNASKLNANAVLGIKIDIEMTSGGITTVSVTGTAVKVA